MRNLREFRWKLDVTRMGSIMDCGIILLLVCSPWTERLGIATKSIYDPGFFRSSPNNVSPIFWWNTVANSGRSFGMPKMLWITELCSVPAISLQTPSSKVSVEKNSSCYPVGTEWNPMKPDGTGWNVAGIVLSKSLPECGCMDVVRNLPITVGFDRASWVWRMSVNGIEQEIWMQLLPPLYSPWVKHSRNSN
jgi:hypothetical protein